MERVLKLPAVRNAHALPLTAIWRTYRQRQRLLAFRLRTQAYVALPPK